MNRFALKNTFIKIDTYHFLINSFIKIRSQSYALKIVSLSKRTTFTNLEGVFFYHVNGTLIIRPNLLLTK